MYSRIYTSKDRGMNIPPDYSGSAIKRHPPETIVARELPPEPQPEKKPEKKPSPPEKENGGYLKELLSGLSADYLLIYGAIAYLTLSGTEGDMALFILLLLVLL